MKVLFYFESFHRLFFAQKPFEAPLNNFIKVVKFFIFYPQRRGAINQKIEYEAFRYRSLKDLAENTITKQSARINIER